MSGHFLLGERDRYVAKSMLVVRTARGEKYLQSGRMLPTDADDVHVEQLLERGLIEQVQR